VVSERQTKRVEDRDPTITARMKTQRPRFAVEALPPSVAPERDRPMEFASQDRRQTCRETSGLSVHDLSGVGQTAGLDTLDFHETLGTLGIQAVAGFHGRIRLVVNARRTILQLVKVDVALI